MRISPVTLLILAGSLAMSTAQYTLCYTGQYCYNNNVVLSGTYNSAQACYAGCIADNPQYGYFDWYARSGGTQPQGSCYCGLTCGGLGPDSGTDTYAIDPNTCFGAPTPAPTPSCLPGVPLNALAPKVSRRSIRAGSSKPVGATYTLRVKGQTKGTRLTNMGVTVTLPAGVALAKTPAVPKLLAAKEGTRVTVSGNQVTWYPVTFTGTKPKKFSLRATLSPPFAANARKVFAAEIFQDSNGAATNYCPLPAPDATVTVA